jgi:hypothetical protein
MRQPGLFFNIFDIRLRNCSRKILAMGMTGKRKGERPSVFFARTRCPLPLIPPSGTNTVQVGMQRQGLSPGVQDGDHAGLPG